MAGLEGRTLDRYQLQRLIGRGGMADVYLGFDPRFQRDVAIKVFKREDEGMLRRFIREAKLMASLRNPYLMPVYDSGETTVNGLSRYYIVMPFMEGGTLRARIKRSRPSLKETCRYLKEIASALDYMHQQGIIHRDIKSSNVLLNDEDRCFLSDFGIARTTTDATQMTSTGDVLGTVDYVAPELFEMDRRADARSDFYSLGVLLFEMVTGQMPFKAENQIALIAMHMNQLPPAPRTIVPNLSPQVERVMLRALEKNPERRYGSATELADAFCQAVTAPAKQEPLILRTEPPLPPTRKTGEYYPAYDQRQVLMPPPVPEKKRRRASPARARGIVLTVMALLALLAVVGPMLYIILTGAYANFGSTVSQNTTTATTAQSPTATPDLTATAQVVAANATREATNKTATAIAGTTATAQAQVTATAGVIVTATAGKAIYTDALNNADNPDTVAAQWDQSADCSFNTDGYHVTAQTDILRQGTLHGCLEAGHRYTNATVSVDMVIQSGHSGGLFFHVKTNALGAYAGYLFEIDSKGNYKVSRASNYSTGSGYVALQDWTASSAIKTGTAKNTLQVIMRDGSELFYVNGTFLVSIQDATYASGDLALLATTSNNGDNAEVVYSNLRVYAA
ncbi:MAG TPA: serine/threonine-protein kinase [Ktedonobacteraceae bacterium]|nr:serine/threonine-protein kinase [Ktedonobacteraceae bacterium]